MKNNYSVSVLSLCLGIGLLFLKNPTIAFLQQYMFTQSPLLVIGELAAFCYIVLFLKPSLIERSRSIPIIIWLGAAVMVLAGVSGINSIFPGTAIIGNFLFFLKFCFLCAVSFCIFFALYAFLDTRQEKLAN